MPGESQTTTLNAQRADKAAAWLDTTDQVRFTDFDTHVFGEGTHSRLYCKLGAHRARDEAQSAEGTHFAVWAPGAQRVYVAGDFNGWNTGSHPLSMSGDSGIWSGFLPEASVGAAYHFHVVDKEHRGVNKEDPFAWRLEGAPSHAAVVSSLDYVWGDEAWMALRAARQRPDAPISIYRVHLASWRRVPEQGNRWLTYSEAGPLLVEHLRRTGFTHVQFTSLMQPAIWFPRDKGVAGFFAADARFGQPHELMALIDHLHQNGFGVLLEFNLEQFPDGEYGLQRFDGTPLYELGEAEPQTSTAGDLLDFDRTKPQVRSFLLSAACFWLDRFHVDGLRVELRSTADLSHRDLLKGVRREYPDVLLVSNLADDDAGVFRQDAGMEQALVSFFSSDYAARGWDLAQFTARVQPTVDVVVGAGKPTDETSPHARMMGDPWQKAANYKLMLGWLWLQPGKKELFMGHEFAQWQAWNPLTSLDWHLLEHRPHRCIMRWLEDLNRMYRQEPALHLGDGRPEGFEWVSPGGNDLTAVAWLRRDPARRHVLLVACNFTPNVRHNFFVGVRRPGYWKELLNSDSTEYGGTEQGNFGGVCSAPFPHDGLPHTLTITLPPLAVVVFKFEPDNNDF